MWDKKLVPRFTWRYCRWYYINCANNCAKSNSFSIAISCILSRNASWSINRVLIEKANKILKAKCSKSFFTYINYDSCWTIANVSLNPDLFFLDNMHLVEKGNLKLAETIFSSIRKLQRRHL